MSLVSDRESLQRWGSLPVLECELVIKVERYAKSSGQWIKVAEYPDDQREIAEDYAKDRQHVTGRRYRVE